ncbi:TPA: site-specific integrase [Streptococcus suis]|nr:site-specific integrase [Streptococcus suis]
MYLETRIDKNGNETYVVIERYKDPFTNKTKRASVSFKQNNPKAIRQAERELLDKIEKIINDSESKYKSKKIITFGELIEHWFSTWSTTVKPNTVKRERLVLNRLSEMLPNDILLEVITPLLIRNSLEEYRVKYNASHSTMQHIKSTLNKIFDYGVLHSVVPYSPSRVIKLYASISDKKERKERKEAKFLTEAEVQVLFSELNKRRNKNYFDLAIFLVGSGCRIGEASALRETDFDFDKQSVEISKSLQSHDLKVEDFYDDSTKTTAGERTILLPDFVMEAVQRVSIRNKDFQTHMTTHPSEAFWENDYLFKTEYGSPITSQSFRAILTRINKDLRKNCEARYGFKWNKNVVPHSFRHIHISALRNNNDVPLKEIQLRVGHVEVETTNGYTHLEVGTQEKSVQAITTYFNKLDFAQ